MPKLPSGVPNVIMYDNNMYEIGQLEYCELEDRLSVLDDYAPEDRLAGFEWEVYQFLTDKDYELDPPSTPKPKRAPQMNKLIDDPFLPDAPTTSREAKRMLADRVSVNLAPNGEETANKPVRNPWTNQHKLSRNFQPRRTKEFKPTVEDSGGAIGIILLGFALIGAFAAYCSNVPIAQNGQLVRPDGTVVERLNHKQLYGSTPVATPFPTPTVETGEKTGTAEERHAGKTGRKLPQAPASGLKERARKSELSSPLPLPKREGVIVIPKQKLQEVEKTKLKQDY